MIFLNVTPIPELAFQLKHNCPQVYMPLAIWNMLGPGQCSTHPRVQQGNMTFFRGRVMLMSLYLSDVFGHVRGGWGKG